MSTNFRPAREEQQRHEAATGELWQPTLPASYSMNIGNPNTERDICERKHGGNQQSTAAHDRIKGNKWKDRQRILAHLGNGKTCEEIEDELQLKHQTASARISELKRDGNIRQIGTRKTKSGCLAAVWVVI